MNTSGFGKLSNQGKEKVALRKRLREIHSLVREKPKDTLQECKQTEETCPEDFEPKHWYEWVRDSAIDPEVTNLNLKSLSGSSAYSYLLYSPNLSRTNTGRLSSGILRNYQHLDNGGWSCSSIDILTSQDSLWGCLKPNSPKWDEEKGKHRKYEHPPKVPTEVFALKVPPKLWQLVARRYDLALPENYQESPHSAFWQWVMEHPQIPIILCEGAKKAASIVSCGYVAVGLPGVWNGVRQPKDQDGNHDGLPSLIPQLQVFAQKGRRIYFCFDQDSKRQSARSVSKAIAKTAKLFLIQKCEVKVIGWNPVMGKGIDDVIVAFGREKFDDLYSGAPTFDEWSTQQLRQLTYTPDMVINSRYIGEVLPPNDAQLIAVKAPKGTGKSQWIRFLTDPQIRSGERKTLPIVHRIQLGKQLVSQLGLPFINEVRTEGQGSLFGYGLVIDSLHPSSQARFKPEEWHGSTVILDEVMQIIWHLLSSSTCQKERVSIIKTLQELLRTVIATGGKIFIADADLNDVGIDFVEGLLGFSPNKFILENEYKFNEPWTVYKFGGKNPAGLVTELEQQLRLGKKVMLAVSAAKPKSQWGSWNMEMHFKKKFPDLKILRIDRVTVENPEHAAFNCTEDLNKIVVNYDLVIGSPTIETGISIDVKHFDAVFGIFQGVQTTDGVRQHLSRVRPPVPRYIWVAKQGINFVGNGASSPGKLAFSQKSLDKANRAKLAEAGFQGTFDEFSPVCLKTWAKLGAVINCGMWRYEATVLADLKEEGHTIVDWSSKSEEERDPKIIETTEKEVSACRDELYEKYRQDVAAADSLTDAEYQKLDKQRQRKTDEQLQLAKGKLERQYLIPVTPELVEKDDDRWGRQIKLHYLWDTGRQYLQFKDTQAFQKALTSGGGDYFAPDNNRTQMQSKVEVLDALGIDRLYKDSGFHNQHPVIRDIFDKVSRNLYEIKQRLGCDLSKLVKNSDAGIELTQILLGLIGHRMAFYKRQGGRGAEVRLYSSPAAKFRRDPETNKIIPDANGLPIPESDGREPVFEAWLQRDAELKRKSEEEKAAALAAAEEARRQVEEAKAAEEATRQEWLSNESLKDLADILESCESSEELASVREFTPVYAMKEAAKLLSVQKRAEIKQWVVTQNTSVVA